MMLSELLHVFLHSTEVQVWMFVLPRHTMNAHVNSKNLSSALTGTTNKESFLSKKKKEKSTKYCVCSSHFHFISFFGHLYENSYVFHIKHLSDTFRIIIKYVRIYLSDE